MTGPESKAVFLSYASQDAEPARRICDALRAAGVEVWFDQSELRGGDSWDAKIRKQIKECALFMPVISANTQARHEGYFRREWKLAVERTHDMADHVAFLMPVVIDATTDAGAFVPEKFREVQWTRLPAGETNANFCKRLRQLLEPNASRAAPFNTEPQTQASRFAPSGQWRHWRPVGIAAAAAVAVFLLWRQWHGPDRTATSPNGAAQTRPSSPARELIGKIAAIVDKDADASRDEWTLAETMGAQAVSLEPANPEAWAAYANAALGAYRFYFDRARSPLNDAQQRARQAVTLAPDSDDAKLALAQCYAQTPSDRSESEQMLRALLRQHPEDRRMLRGLAELLSLKVLDKDTAATPDRFAEAFGLYDRAAALPGGDPVALREKAAVLAGLGLTQEAETALERSLALRPGPAAQVLRIWSVLINQDDLAAAAALVEKLPGSYYLREDVSEVAAKTWLWKREPGKCLGVINRFHEDFLGATPARYLAGEAYMLQHRPDAARLAWQSALDALMRDLTASASDIHVAVVFLYWKARLLACLGQTAAAHEATQVWEQLRGDASPLQNAALHVSLGEVDEALRALPQRIPRTAMYNFLGRLFRLGAPDLRHDPAWDPLRGRPQFEALLATAQRVPGKSVLVNK